MIAKIPEKRGDGRSSFASLGKYIAGQKVDQESGEIVRSAEDIHLETNCLSIKTAAAEMRAVAEMNGRVNDPVYHCVISWPEHENPTNEQAHKAAMAAMKAVGMDGHQYVMAVHRDSDNAHLHLMINRVHPDSYRAVYPEKDYFRLDKCMREIELEQGWAHDNGPYQVVDGKVVRSQREQPAPALPTKARDMEAATGCESLLTYAQQSSSEIVASLQSGSWQTLHAALRKHGLEIREAGQGFKIHDITDPSATPVKASDVASQLGGGKLKKLLGAYEKPLRVVLAEKPAKTYNPYREKQSAGRDERREARAAARLALRKCFDTEKQQRLTRRQGLFEAEKFAMRDLAMRTRAERERIKAENLTTEARRARLSILAMTVAAERERIKLEGKEQREQARMKGYRAWVGERAEQGDEAAIAQLKGWAYQDSRRRRAAEQEEEAAAKRGAIRAEQTAQEPPARPGPVFKDITWEVDRRTGDVTYRLGGLDALRDTGRQVSVLQSQDDTSIEAGLRLAAQKFGPRLTLTGSTEFQQRAVELAVERGLGVRFANPAAEAYRTRLEAARANHKEMRNGKDGKPDREWSRREAQQGGKGQGR